MAIILTAKQLHELNSSCIYSRFIRNFQYENENKTENKMFDYCLPKK